MRISSLGLATLGWADVDIDIPWYDMNEEEKSKALQSQSALSVLRTEGGLASAALNEGVDFGRSRADRWAGRWWLAADSGVWGSGGWKALEVETER